METDLVDVKQLFSNMMRGVQPWILSHFVMWLDLKVAEYKVLGYMVLDKKSVYDKDQAPPYKHSPKTGTPSPASVSSSEHMYVVPTAGNGLSGDSNHSSQNQNVPKENKEYENFAELVHHNKRKCVSTGGIISLEKSDVIRCVKQSTEELEQCDKAMTENGVHNSRKQRKPGKVLHTIVNNLKQNCGRTSPSKESVPQTGNQLDSKTEDHVGQNFQLSLNTDSDKQIDQSKSIYPQPSIKSANSRPNQHTASVPNDRVVSLITAKTKNREPTEPAESTDPEEENTPLYKSQQFSSLISLSRSRGRRRRSSNDEITYPLITMKDAEISETYDEEPRSQNLADFYFAQNQLDEQFAVRRAKQNICRATSKQGERDGDLDGTFHHVSGDLCQGDRHSNKEILPMIKQEINPSPNKDDMNSRDSGLNNESSYVIQLPNKATECNGPTNLHKNIKKLDEKKKIETVFVKSEPQNDEEYSSVTIGGSYDRLSNQSFSSEGDTTGYHDNSSQFEYHGDDIAEESFTLSNSELYGEDYIGSPQGTHGADFHDNKMVRSKFYKKRHLNCNQNLVPRDPSSGKFVCELCGGTFTNRSSYFRHKRIHGEKKFRCFLCDKAFHRKEHLQSHIHRHTKSFPLKCCQCNYESHSLDEASAHFQTTHNQEMKESP